MQPWEYAIPAVLYKYFRADRLSVLTDCRVRFSQRSVFDDDHELAPDVAQFGTMDEIWRFVLSQGLRLPPELPANVLVQLMAESPKAQAMATRRALGNMKSLDAFGVFCMTETAESEKMWAEYADEEKGFVVAFTTAQAGFGQLTSPGKVGKVSYSDEAYGTYLGMLEREGVSFFFRKRTKYATEAEWRSVRALNRLEARPGGIFLSTFDPASVSEVIIRPRCPIEARLTEVLSTDQRYRHVLLRKIG